ncbi:hypothetical protein ACH0BO_00565 [Brevibacterium luteolum]|uniref:hypothetical protein n=1 Tax=Brevibacterium luteolum TaxID=199591 RepID=UPI003879C7F0
MTHTTDRYPVAELTDLPDDIRTRIEEVGQQTGFVPNVFIHLARRPAEFRAFFAYYDALMEKDTGNLTKADREMIITVTRRLTSACTVWSPTGRCCGSSRRTPPSPIRWR